MTPPTVSRRRVLGAVGLSAIAGCTDFESESGIRVGSIMISNWEEEPVTITVRLDREGSTVFEDAVELGGDGDELIERSWDDSPAEYTVLYSSEGDGRIVDLSLPEDGGDSGDDCIDIHIHRRQNQTDVVIREDRPSWSPC